jgi:U5 small nuclear ribonucleoprotein component
MNDEDNYDEFGNYIGPDIPEINESNKINEENEENEENDSELNMYKNDQNLNNNEMEIDTSINNPPTMFSNLKNTDYQVTLHEEKEYYPAAQQVFPGVETLVMEEDTQPISIPIIPPKVKQKYDYYENVQPKLTYELNFMLNLI